MSTLMQSTATIAAVIGVVKTARWYVVYETAKEESRKEKAFNFYVETGKKEQAFYSLDRYAAKTAKRQRLRRVKEKAMERKHFTAWCECPGCDSLDVHGIEESNNFSLPSLFSSFSLFSNKDTCKRRCRQCGLAWKQR